MMEILLYIQIKWQEIFMNIFGKQNYFAEKLESSIVYFTYW